MGKFPAPGRVLRRWRRQCRGPLDATGRVPRRRARATCQRSQGQEKGASSGSASPSARCRSSKPARQKRSASSNRSSCLLSRPNCNSAALRHVVGHRIFRRAGQFAQAVEGLPVAAGRHEQPAQAPTAFASGADRWENGPDTSCATRGDIARSCRPEERARSSAPFRPAGAVLGQARNRRADRGRANRPAPACNSGSARDQSPAFR